MTKLKQFLVIIGTSIKYNCYKSKTALLGRKFLKFLLLFNIVIGSWNGGWIWKVYIEIKYFLIALQDFSFDLQFVYNLFDFLLVLSGYPEIINYLGFCVAVGILATLTDYISGLLKNSKKKKTLLKGIK